MEIKGISAILTEAPKAWKLKGLVGAEGLEINGISVILPKAWKLKGLVSF